MQMLPEDWKALELIGKCERGYCAESLARLDARGFIRAKLPEGFELTKEGWRALRQHRRVNPD